MASEFEWNMEQGGQDQSPQPEQEEKQEPRGSELFYWLQTLVVSLVCIVLVFTFVGRITRVVGSSMVPTLQEGEMLLIWSLGYEPEQGDIVVLNKTTATFLRGDGGEAIVKRVIATGGQTVDIDYATSNVYVDGVALDEPYIKEYMFNPGGHMSQTHWEVPEGSVFVMGDNRNGSTDSRDERLGCIDQDYILGKAVLAIWPVSAWGAL